MQGKWLLVRMIEYSPRERGWEREREWERERKRGLQGQGYYCRDKDTIAKQRVSTSSLVLFAIIAAR